MDEKALLKAIGFTIALILGGAVAAILAALVFCEYPAAACAALFIALYVVVVREVCREIGRKGGSE